MKRSEVLIVGSGVGGATVAKELVLRGMKVTILEKGLRYFGQNRHNWNCLKSHEGIDVLSTMGLGGSSVVSLANGIRSLEKELINLGIRLDNEFKEAEELLGISPVPDSFIGERTKILMKVSEDLGYKMKIMPKFIDFSKCKGCGLCVEGCRHDAKWSAERYIKEAIEMKANFLAGQYVRKVIHSNGVVKGVTIQSQNGISIKKCDTVVLSAGGIGTPLILQHSGVNYAGTNLFAGLNSVTWGIMKKWVTRNEISMATMIDEFIEKDGFMLSPFFVGRKSRGQELLEKYSQISFLQKIPFLKQKYRTLGLIIKIADDDMGTIDTEEGLHKSVSSNDREKMEKGRRIADNILQETGLDYELVKTTEIQGSHPGGTAGIGRVVDRNHETEIEGLYVCDASVLPKASGVPPILTIVALAKRFSKILAS